MNIGDLNVRPVITVGGRFIAHIHFDAIQELASHTGFVPVHQYASLTPLEGEVGSIDDVRFIVSDFTTEEFVTTEEFIKFLAVPGTVRESPIRASNGGVTYICLVPPEMLP